MTRVKLGVVVASVLAGGAVALFTGLLESTPGGLVGAVWYGYPLAWLFRAVLAPQYYPWRFDALALLADVLVWSAVVGVVLTVVRLTRGARSRA